MDIRRFMLVFISFHSVCYGQNVGDNLACIEQALLSINAVTPIQQQPASDFSVEKVSVDTWILQCKNIGEKPSVKKEDFLATISTCIAEQQANLKKASWINDTKPDFTDAFQPFVKKLVVPAGSTLFISGDLHGNITAFASYLQYLKDNKILDNQFKIIPKNTYLIFLGDYTDRGVHGIEVMCTLARLIQANPENSCVMRGNHEDPSINQGWGYFTLMSEILNYIPKELLGFKTTPDQKEKAKTETERIFSVINSWYNDLPVVLYLGVIGDVGKIHYIQCCHGGMELGYNPKSLLASDKTYERILTLDRAKNFDQLPKNVTYAKKQIIQKLQRPVAELRPGNIGFMWSDFVAEGNEDLTTDSTRGREIFTYGKLLTDAILDDQSAPQHVIEGVFRGHQHNSSMPGMEHGGNIVTLTYGHPIFTIVSTPIESEDVNACFGKLQLSANFGSSLLSKISLNGKAITDVKTIDSYKSDKTSIVSP